MTADLQTPPVGPTAPTARALGHGTALLATATWTVSVLVADRMRRVGYRGPFELLTRRATYRSATNAQRA